MIQTRSADNLVITQSTFMKINGANLDGAAVFLSNLYPRKIEISSTSFESFVDLKVPLFVFTKVDDSQNPTLE